MQVALQDGDTLVTDRKTAMIKVAFLQRKIAEHGGMGPTAGIALAVLLFFWVPPIGMTLALVTGFASMFWYFSRQQKNADIAHEIALLRIAYEF